MQSSWEKIFNNYVRSRVLQQFKISFNEFKENAMSFLLLKKFLIAVYCVQPCVANEEFLQKKSWHLTSWNSLDAACGNATYAVD